MQYKHFFTISTTEHLDLDQKYSVNANTIDHKDLMPIGVEIHARKSLQRGEFEQCT